MTNPCLSLSDLLERDLWPADDPRRVHLEQCPRCQGLLLSYEAFVQPPDIPEGADLDDARARLTTDFRGLKTGRPAPVRTSGPQPAETRAGLFDTFMGFLVRPAFRFGLGAAVVVLLLIGLPQVIRSPRYDPDSRVLRNSEQTADLRGITTTIPQRQADRVLLRWQTTDEVDAYQVLFFDSGLTEIARFDAGLDTQLVLALDGLPVPSAEWDTLFWRVSGRRGADEVVHSQMMSLELLD